MNYVINDKVLNNNTRVVAELSETELIRELNDRVNELKRVKYVERRILRKQIHI